MTIYTWQQHYGLDRFDLSGSCGFPMGGIGWVTRNPNTPGYVGTVRLVRNRMGYITSMLNIDAPEATFHWRVWWPVWTDGKVTIHSDNIHHKRRADAMLALQKQFGIDSRDVREVKWEGNLTEYA